MKLSLLSSIRLVMMLLLSYFYYLSVEDHTTLQTTYVIIAALGFCINHFLIHTPFAKNYFSLAIGLDSILILGFVFLFPESTLYLILFGVNAVTLFLIADNKKIIWGFSLAFFIMWAACILYIYQETGIFDIPSNIINFTFIVFEAIVGRLIHKLLHAQEKIKDQYDELQETHQALTIAHEQLHDYSMQVEKLTLVQERNRISGEIHDTVGHKMTALLVQLQVAKELMNIQPEKSRETILLCEELARNALQELRLSVRTLKEDNQNRSFIVVVKKILEDYQEMTGLKSNIYVKGDVLQIPPSIQLDLTRMIQESITNAVRHGQATECHVSIEIADSAIETSIKDNGTGSPEVNPGFGMKNMRERVHHHGGQIVFESNPREGFIVKASFPLREMHWEMGGA
ncbi:sensor histidine kinase [Siminovitchia acidinfaciens]|nr:sensor histidine kinase [Siminovitchia acidinfaciens]